MTGRGDRPPVVPCSRGLEVGVGGADDPHTEKEGWEMKPGQLELHRKAGVEMICTRYKEIR